MRRLAATVTAVLLGAGLAGLAGTPARPALAAVPPVAVPPVAGPAGLLAGAAVVDASWHVGAAAGQYGSTTPTDSPDDALASEWDPNAQHTLKTSSYGMASRLSVRVLVLQSGDEAPVALVKQDLYLAQDLVTRRAAQILAADGSRVTYDHLLLSATHDHSSPYYSTPSAGVYVFQDAFDLRFFEYQAEAIAHAVEQAEGALRPARLGATTVDLPAFQTNIVGPSIAEDGTPAGYPRAENDHGLVVVRVDGLDARPIATWVNYAEHGESLDGYDLISADYLAPLQRYVDRDTGAPLIFSQGAVGSSEGPYEGYFPRASFPRIPVGPSAGVLRIFSHGGYPQAERGARVVADAVEQGRDAVGRGDAGVQVPMRSALPVRMVTDWIPGPVSHPYPSYGNCGTAGTIDGDPGAPGLPDCERASGQAPSPVPQSQLFETLRGAGLPVPDTYSGSAFNAVEENLRIKLQAVRLGDILLASCSCEPQVDLVKNLETRLDDVAGNAYDGYDYVDDHGDPAHGGCTHQPDTTWTCRQPDPNSPGAVRVLAGLSDASIRRMQAEVHNDAAGWDDPANAATANAEPADPARIFGNFTHTELPAGKGFALVVGLGHTGDYDGYTVSYREYENRESYRKALTAYGPHTADYVNTHLMQVALNLRDGTPIPPVPNQAQGDADEKREQTEAVALGQLGQYYLSGWDATRPDDAGPAAVTGQPAPSYERFSGPSVTWRGGSNWTDNPTVRVQRLVNGRWRDYADQSGEVVTTVHVPPGVTTIATDRTGSQQWVWTATFEAFDAWPRADVSGGQVPDGTYRFVMAGHIHTGGAVTPYSLSSSAFDVRPWEGLEVSDPALAPGGGVVVRTDPVVYPRSYPADASFPFVRDDGGDPLSGNPTTSLLCRTCSFRPWARTGAVSSLRVSVVRGGRVVRTVPAVRQVDGSWRAATHLTPGEVALVARAGERDFYGEINGLATRAIGPDGTLGPAPPVGAPSALPETLPEAPWVPVLPLAGLGVGAVAAVLLGRRRGGGGD